MKPSLSLSIIVPVCNPSPNDITNFLVSLDLANYFVSEVIFCSFPHSYYLRAHFHRICSSISSNTVVKELELTQRGIFSAQNIGASIATAKYVLFMGIDDSLCSLSPICLLKVQQALLCCQYDLLLVPYKAQTRIYRSRVSFVSAFIDTIHQQGTLYKASLFGNANFFDSSLKLYANFITSHYAALSKLSYRYIQITQPIVLFSLDGLTGSSRWFLFERYRESSFIFSTLYSIPAMILFNFASFALLSFIQLRKLVRTAN